MGDILESKQLGDEEKAKLYNQVLQRYLTYYDQRKGQPLHVKLTTPKTTETPKPVTSVCEGPGANECARKLGS